MPRLPPVTSATLPETENRSDMGPHARPPDGQTSATKISLKVDHGPADNSAGRGVSAGMRGAGRPERRPRRVAARHRSRELRLRWRDFDVESVSPRISAAVFLFAGILGLLAETLLPSDAVD